LLALVRLTGVETGGKHHGEFVPDPLSSGGKMKTRGFRISTIAALLFTTAGLGLNGAAERPTRILISSEPLHQGRISPSLYGGFIELLDDVVPGMWAEMLGDRGFEGLLPTSKWCYFRGEPNLCDRDWDKNETWDYDRENPFNGEQSARLAPSKVRPARLSQSRLHVRKGLGYRLSGYFQGDSRSLKVKVSIKALLPDGSWAQLSTIKLAHPGKEWRKFEGRFVSQGTTDAAVFEIEATGRGRLWLDKLSLMPEDNIQGWRKDVVEATRKLNPPVIRWGGSTVDPGGYRWKEALGDRDLRRPFVNTNWGRRDTNDVGVEEFVRFCRAAGAEPLLCVSRGDGAESAGQMVEYLNGPPDSEWGKKRAANGQPAPYGVKFWQVGNEIDDPAYVDELGEFIRAIRKADPGAVVLSSFPTQELINRHSKDMDIVCPHYYQADLDGVDSGLSRIEEWIKGSARPDHVKIGVTEWNIDAGNWGLGRGKLNTLGCALFEARFLNLLHRHSDAVTLACRSNLTNSFCGGTIQTNGGALYRTPSFHVMALYRKHSLSVPLRVAVDAPAPVDVSACADESRSSLCLFVVNTRKEAVDLELDLTAFGAGFIIKGGEVIGDTQDRQQVDVINSFSSPDRVRPVKLEKREGNNVTIPALSVAAIDCGKE
jgi:alpha-L-arabinofuranosidase